MDPQRFDRLTQALARRLRPAGGAEPRAAPEAPPASGTCAYPELATAEPGDDPRPAAAICVWEPLPAVPAPSDGPPPARMRRAVRRQRGHQRGQPPTARERQIAALIGQGLKDREIAAALVLSEHTVHAHVRNLLAKLGLASRTQIAAWVAARAPEEQAER